MPQYPYVPQNQPAITVVTLTAATTTSTTDVNLTNNAHRGVQVIVDITAVSGTVDLVVGINGINPVTGAAYQIMATDTLSATGATIFTVYPGMYNGTTLTASSVQPLPRQWQITYAISGTSPVVTATISYAYLV